MFKSLQVRLSVFVLILNAFVVVPAYAHGTGVHINTNNFYALGERINVSVTNKDANPIIVNETGQCHRFISVFDSSGNELLISDPTMACTLEFRSITIAHNESKIVDTWDQMAYNPCPLAYDALYPWPMPCPPGKTQVPDGVYTIKVFMDDGHTVERSITIGDGTTMVANVTGVSLNPTNPTLGQDVTVTITGDLPTPGWIIKEVRETRQSVPIYCFRAPCPPNQTTIGLTVIAKNTLPPGTVVAQVIQPYSYNYVLKNLVAGNYLIEVRGNNQTITNSFNIVVPSFTDVPQSHWAYTYIQYLFENGIARGYGNGRFGPENDITRAEIVKIAMNAARLHGLYPLPDRCIGDTSTTNFFPLPCFGYAKPFPFRDVPTSHSLYPYIYEAYQLGIIPGGDYFYPDQKATRFECLQILLNAFEQIPIYPTPMPMMEGSGTSGSASASPGAFSDVASPEQRAYTDFAAGEGIVSGFQGKFYPNQNVTRAEISKIVYNLLT